MLARRRLRLRRATAARPVPAQGLALLRHRDVGVSEQDSALQDALARGRVFRVLTFRGGVRPDRVATMRQPLSSRRLLRDVRPRGATVGYAVRTSLGLTDAAARDPRWVLGGRRGCLGRGRQIRPEGGQGLVLYEQPRVRLVRYQLVVHVLAVRARGTRRPAATFYFPQVPSHDPAVDALG